MEYIISPSITKSHQSASKSGEVSSILGGGSDFFLLHQEQELAVHILMDQIKIHLLAPLSEPPKLVFFFMTVVTLKLIFGKVDYFDNLASFAEFFGDKPKSSAPKITMLQDSTSTASSLYSFGRKCELDVFLYLFKKYYVRHDSVDNSLYV